MFNNKHRLVSLATVIILMFSSVGAYAERLIPFQGRLTDGNGNPLQKVERVTFVIYDEPTGGTALWQEVHENVSIIGGQVNVLLGSIANLDDLDGDLVLNEPNDALDFTHPRYLGITIGAATNQEMLPRHQLVPSFHARTTDRAFTADHATLADRATMAADAEHLGGRLPDDYALAVGTDTSLTQLTQRLDALETFANAYTVPTGTILPLAGPNLPANKAEDFYYCEGQWVRYQNADGSVVPENEALWNVIGFRYGKQALADGSINFRLPDYRGMFLRGWARGSGHDPDRGSRTGYDVDGNAVTGDFIGTYQGSQLQSHRHTMSTVTEGTKGGGTSVRPGPGGYATSYAGGNETRPRNMSVRYIIKR